VSSHCIANDLQEGGNCNRKKHEPCKEKILTKNKRVKGVNMTPIRQPITEFKTAAASFPPAALVRMTADDTGGGMQPTVINLMEIDEMHKHNISGSCHN